MKTLNNENQGKKMSMWKKGLILGSILVTSFTASTQIATASTTETKHVSANTHVHAHAFTAEDENFITAYSTKNRLITSLDAATSQLLVAYHDYMRNTPVPERTADDFYTTLYRTNPFLLNQLENGEFEQNLIQIRQIKEPKNDRLKKLNSQQNILADEYEFYLQVIQEYIESNGSAKYSPVLLDAKPNYKTVPSLLVRTKNIY